MKRWKYRQGLTLIETLVVVAIIAVLIAIVFVAMGSVREKGRQVVCISHLKQLGQAITMYRQDYGGGAAEGRYFEMALPPSAGFLLRSKYIGWKPVPHQRPTVPPEIWTCPDNPRRPMGMTAYIYMVCDNKYGGLGTPVRQCSDPRNEPDFPERVKQRGSEYPLLIDKNHNIRRNPSDPLFVIALRLDGHLNSHYVDPFTAGWRW